MYARMLILFQMFPAVNRPREPEVDRPRVPEINRPREPEVDHPRVPMVKGWEPRTISKPYSPSLNSFD